MFLKKCLFAPVRSDRNASPEEYTLIGGHPVLRSCGGTVFLFMVLIVPQKGPPQGASCVD